MILITMTPLNEQDPKKKVYIHFTFPDLTQEKIQEYIDKKWWVYKIKDQKPLLLNSVEIIECYNKIPEPELTFDDL